MSVSPRLCLPARTASLAGAGWRILSWWFQGSTRYNLKLWVFFQSHLPQTSPFLCLVIGSNHLHPALWTEEPGGLLSLGPQSWLNAHTQYSTDQWLVESVDAESMDTGVGLLYYAIVLKTLEHLWILISAGEKRGRCQSWNQLPHHQQKEGWLSLQFLSFNFVLPPILCVSFSVVSNSLWPH